MNLILLTLAIGLCFSPAVESIIERNTFDYDVNVLSEALLSAIRSLVNDLGSILSVTVSSQDMVYMDIKTAIILNYLLKNLTTLTTYHITLREEGKGVIASKFNLILIDEFKSLVDLYHGLDERSFYFAGERSFYFAGHYIIGLTNAELWNSDQINWVMNNFWELYITNLAVMVINLNNTDEVLTYTYYPFGHMSCEVPVRVLINTYRASTKSFDRPHYHFPDKFQNLHKCPLKVAIVQSMPFARVQRNRLIGFEGLLVQELGRIMNFRIKVIPVNKDSSQGQILPNGTAVGVLAYVQNQTANFCVGFFDLSNRKVQEMDHTVIYHSERMYFLAPPKKTLSGLQFLLVHFHKFLWLVLLVLALVLGFYRLLIQTGSVSNVFDEPYFSLTVLNITGMMVGASIIYQPVNLKRRVIFGSLCLLLLVLRSAYQSSYYLYTQTPQEHVSTLDEMIANNFTYYSYPHFKSFLDSIPQIDGKIIYNNSRKFLLAKENEVIRTLGIRETRLTTETSINYKNFLRAGKGSFRVNCRDPLTSVGVAMFLKKYSCLTNVFNDNILRLSQSGLIDWFRKRYQNDDIKSFIRDEYRKRIRPIKFREISGAFIVLIAGLILSIMAFVYEWVTAI